MLMAELLVLQLLIPLGLLAWLAFGRARSRAGWVLGIALVGGYLAAVALAGLWLLGLVSGYTLGGLLHILLIVAIIVVLIRVIFQTLHRHRCCTAQTV